MPEPSIIEHEDGFRAELEQTEEWYLASVAVEGLRAALIKVGPRKYEGPADQAGATLRLYAYLVMGVRIFRTIRAAMAVLSIGYEPEARALDRILVELMAHRRAIIDDPSGEEAHAWLAGKRERGIAAKVRTMAPRELYENMSQEAHGDPRAVWSLYDHRSEAIIVGPQRKPFAARASLLMHAGLAIDQLRLIVAGANLEAEGVGELAERVRAANKRLAAEGDTGGFGDAPAQWRGGQHPR